MQHENIIKMLNFDKTDPIIRVEGGGGFGGKIFPTMFLHFVITLV